MKKTRGSMSSSISQGGAAGIPAEFHRLIELHPVRQTVEVPKIGRRGGSVTVDFGDMQIRVAQGGHSVSVDVALSGESTWHGLQLLLFLLEKAEDPLKHAPNVAELAEWLTTFYEEIVSFLRNPQLCDEYQRVEEARIRYLMGQSE